MTRCAPVARLSSDVRRKFSHRAKWWLYATTEKSAYLTSHRMGVAFSCTPVAVQLISGREERTKTAMTTATAAIAVLRKINYKRVGTVSAVLVLFSILFSMALVPKLLKSQLKKVRDVERQFSGNWFSLSKYLFSPKSLQQNLVLKDGTELRKLWSKAPFAVTFKIYIFNITNPDEVVRGGKVCAINLIFSSIFYMKILFALVFDKLDAGASWD